MSTHYIESANVAHLVSRADIQAQITTEGGVQSVLGYETLCARGRWSPSRWGLEHVTWPERIVYPYDDVQMIEYDGYPTRRWCLECVKIIRELALNIGIVARVS